METIHPLKQISQIFQISLADIANELDVKRQTVNEWVGKRRRPIPKKHIPKIAAIFNLDERWFEKSLLKGSEVLELQRIYIDRNATFEEYEDFFVDDDGVEQVITKYYSPEQDVSRQLHEEEKVKSVIEDVQQLLERELGDYNNYYQDIMRGVLSIVDSKERGKVRMLSDVIDFLLYRDHGFGGFDIKDKNVEGKFDEIYEYYQKK
ncbi:hypothetical protein CN689_14215 [Peribacillus butanolivorans]|uniref:HTH cro/C1-type domain-containing protein n=1 Tax=Peribacillus butanolivorans TaxID=421767 RepID=A0AAX0S3I4_9BACI|nr:helix-turn-helix transcriptional regulator [Peribacillus butanolivorans]PEJ32280.1 hypothetical protein CN689_14215 [Peribacillus butanolivorans]